MAYGHSAHCCFSNRCLALQAPMVRCRTHLNIGGFVSFYTFY